MIAPLMCKMIIGDQDFVKQFLSGGFCLILYILVWFYDISPLTAKNIVAADLKVYNYLTFHRPCPMVR